MPDHILVRRSIGAVSSLLHLIFNILLGVFSILITIFTDSWVPGIILVLMSKWRIFAVRPRFWFLNLKSALVDLIVGISFILISHYSGHQLLPIHILLALGYTLWLIILKPRSSPLAYQLQALTAVLLGTTAAILTTTNLDSSLLALSCFLIGYSSARHILVQNEDKGHSFLSLIAGLIFAEIAWLFHSWLIIYMFSGTGIVLPQLTIILSIISFVISSIYRSTTKHDGKIKLNEVVMPISFTILIITVIIIWFSKPIFNV